MTDYKSISSKYKIKFYNFFLNSYLNKFGGYNIDHDEMIYKLANFGSKIRPTYISFAFGTKQEDMYGFIDMLEEFEIFDIKQFLIDKINLIEQNFNISHYDLKIQSGIQELSLFSDKIIINDVEYYKSFFILNYSPHSLK